MTIMRKFLTRDEDAFLAQAAASIIGHYGKGNQVIKLVEETSEFNAAMAKYLTEPTDEHLAAAQAELADVILVLDQIVSEFADEDGTAIAHLVVEKAARQLRRIGDEESAAAHRDPAHGC